MPKALLRGFSFIAGVILFMPTFILHEYTSFAYVLQTALVVGAIVLINSPRYNISIFGWWSLWGMLSALPIAMLILYAVLPPAYC